jgi:hypothetical protein
MSWAKLSYQMSARSFEARAPTHKYLQGDNVTRVRSSSSPFEEIALDNLHMILQPGCFRPLALSRRKLTADLNDPVFGPGEHFGVFLLDEP